ncbi:DUF3078 domain-containing protein [Flavobacterium pallidum]|uniref:DUF3078 domain-containing protein n=1 Tax=Flavobacterium pallidum TaxID=2172098 RepID=A0A2S1SEP7_9FLAO|nr:DUF3078 domain-containing protein [Flavobacterium pallidum]AWI24883.1 hypothetical protein HYN49_02675 [Flavobacterium pallidum]
MKLIRIFLIGCIAFKAIQSAAQTKDTIITVEKKIIVKVPDSVSPWQRKNTIGFDLSEIAFVNWSAGGTSSVSGLLKGNFTRIYNKGNFKWGNEMIVRYGVNKQDGIELRKTDDAFQFTSTAGYRRDSVSNWYHSAKFSFNTQFTNGYNYPNTEMPISKPLAPAYTFLGVGAEYSNKEKKINLYISPLTLKNTMVLDQRLADQGAFGVTKAIYDDVTGERLKKGRQMKTELGFLFTSHFKKEIFKNITFEHRLNLYSDYLNHFGNIDVDWQAQLDLVVNQYVKANIGFNLIYDDDIKGKEEKEGEQITVGPKVQLKQVLGIGLVYNF